MGTIQVLIILAVIELIAIVFLFILLGRRKKEIFKLDGELSNTKQKTYSCDKIVEAPLIEEIKSAIGTERCITLHTRSGLPFSCKIRGVSCYAGGYDIEAKGPGNIFAAARIFYKEGTEEKELSPGNEVNTIAFKFS